MNKLSLLLVITTLSLSEDDRLEGSRVAVIVRPVLWFRAQKEPTGLLPMARLHPKVLPRLTIGSMCKFIKCYGRYKK